MDREIDGERGEDLMESQPGGRKENVSVCAQVEKSFG